MKQIIRHLVLVVSGFCLISCGDSQVTQSSSDKAAESAPALSLRLQRPTFSEGETVAIGVSLNRALPVNTELIWEIVSEAQRFNSSTGAVLIPSGSTGTMFELTTINNLMYDGEGAVRLRVRDSAGAIAPVEISLVLVDDDARPFVSIADQEGVRGSRIELAIELSAASTLNTIVNWRTLDATAEAGTDYEAASGVAVIAAGETRAVIGVKTKPLARDTSFVVKLTGVENAAFADSSATVHILPGTSLDTKVSFADASSTVTEAPVTSGITLQLTAAIGADVSVDLLIEGDATAGTDYTALPVSITIPAGASSAVLPVQILDDAIFEREETLRVRMKSSTNASFGMQTVHTLQIRDNDDLPSISVSDAQAIEGRALSFAVSLGQVSGADTTFSYTTVNGSAGAADYTPVAGTVTIPAGQTLARVSVATLAETLHENSEDMFLVLSEANGATLLRPSARGTIVDDDAAPSVQFDLAGQIVGLSESLVNVQVNLSAVSGATVSIPFHVGGTAIEGLDHNLAAGVINIPAGQASGSISFSVFRHGPPAKTAVITMESAVGATLGSVIEHTVEF